MNTLKGFTFVLIFVANLVSLYGNVLEHTLNKNINLNSLTHSKLSQKCKNSFENYLQALTFHEYWAYKMYDSGGKIPSGLLSGNIHDFGDFDQCLSIRPNVEENKNNISGKYCLATFFTVNERKLANVSYDFEKIELFMMHNRKINSLRLGVCVPDACSAKDLEIIYLQSGIKMIFEDNLCQTSRNVKFENRLVIGLIIIFLLICLVILGTITEFFSSKPESSFLTSFSLIMNGKSLFLTTEIAKDNFSCLYGLRTLYTFIIIAAHKFYAQCALLPIKNTFFQFNYVEDPTVFFVMGASYCVESFFLLSSFLVSFGYFKNCEKEKKFNSSSFYFNRIIRLLPNLLFTIIFCLTLSDFMGSGPIYSEIIQEYILGRCEPNWWKSLLFIQNFMDPNKICIIGTWYLATDMQLYLITPLFLYLLSFKPKFGILINCFVIIGSVAITFIVSWTFELRAFADINRDIPENIAIFFNYYFYPIYTRAATWNLGILLGYLIYKNQQKKIVIGKITSVFMWIVSIIVIFFWIFCGQPFLMAEYNKLHHSLFMSLTNLVWSLANSWVIYRCVCGEAPTINAFLSLPIFQFLGKLNYSIFIVNVPVIWILFARLKTVTHFTNMSLWREVWGDYFIIIFASIFMHLCVDIPFWNLKNYLIKTNKEHKKTN